MKIFYFLIMCCHKINGKLSELERIEYCKTLQCDDTVHEKICGMRKANGNNAYLLFDNECLLLKYGCQVGSDDAYGITDLHRCNEYTSRETEVKSCPNCLSVEKKPICGIRTDGDGYRVRIFANKCKLNKHNCKQDLRFYATNFYICVGNTNDTIKQNNSITDEYIQKRNNKVVSQEIEANNKIDGSQTTVADKGKKVYKNIIVVGGSMSDMMNINETVKNFFAATHVFDLPVRELPTNLNENTRKRLIRVFGPVKVFTPWLRIPENITEDYYHKPTLSSCFHKCPKKCPDTYAPVCGVPGIVAREPSLMFQNHCFMDVAQCKMFWEDKSWTAQSSAYIESSFLFCLGDELNGLYRFLPLIRTLQHMGRLRSKGHFKYKIKNMRFFNQLINKQPNLMG